METISVLAVDDDEDILRFFSTLMANEGLRVEGAKSGEEALAQLEKFEPELIIADIQMPGTNGYELCRQIRAKGYDDIPFIFCSVRGSLPERVMGLNMGADDYVVKPIDAEEILLKVQRLLGKSRKYQAMKALALERRKGGILEGALGEVSVIDLLQLISYLNLNCVRIRLDRRGNEDHAIFMKDRTIVHAQSGPIIGKKALFRMLTWKEGRFQVDDAAFENQPSMSEPLEHCLMEGVVHVDEVLHLRESLNNAGDYVTIQYGPEIFRRRFGESTLEILCLIEEFHFLDKILDQSPLTDLQIMRILMELQHTRLIALGCAP